MGKKTNFSDLIKLSLYLSFQNSVLPDIIVLEVEVSLEVETMLKMDVI